MHHIKIILPDLLQVLVTVDELALVGVLELVGLDVLPEGLDDDRPGLGVNPQHTSQSGVQLELWGLRDHTEKKGDETTSGTKSDFTSYFSIGKRFLKCFACFTTIAAYEL